MCVALVLIVAPSWPAPTASKLRASPSGSVVWSASREAILTLSETPGARARVMSCAMGGRFVTVVKRLTDPVVVFTPSLTVTYHSYSVLTVRLLQTKDAAVWEGTLMFVPTMVQGAWATML